MQMRTSHDHSRMQLDIYVIERFAPGEVQLRLSTGEWVPVPDGHEFPEPTWSIPFEMLDDVRKAIGPARVEMSDKLLDILDREQDRVDRFIATITGD